MIATNIQKAAGCCTNLYNASAKGVNWLGRNAKTLGVAAWDGVKKVAAFASAVFAKLGQYLMQGFTFVKAGLTQSYSKMSALVSKYPKEFGMAAGVTALVGGVLFCCKKNEAAPAPAAAPAEAAPAAV